MNRNLASMTPHTLARIAGVIYLIVAITGSFAQIVRTQMMVAGDATATAENVLKAEGLFRLGFSSDLVAFSAEVVLAVVVFTIFRPVSAPLAMLAALFRLGQAAVLAINMLMQFFVILLLNGDRSLAAFEPAQVNALAQLFLEAHSYGYFIGLVFFGLHNIVLGYLVITSGFFPKVLGYFLMLVVSGGYLIDSFGNFLFADYPGIMSAIVITPAALVEFAFIVWLIVKGMRHQERDAALVPATA